MSIHELQKKIQDLYKFSSMSETAPRFESVNGTPEKLSLNFVSITNRSSMDSVSWKKLLGLLQTTYQSKYRMTGFSMGRNFCSIIVEKYGELK